MKDTKLYKIISCLDKYEQNRCAKYVQSPYFNRSEELVGLYYHITQHINQQTDTILDKTALWEAIHPEKDYDDVRFRKYLSDLYKLIEGFFIQERIEMDELGKINYLLETIKYKKIDFLYDYVLRKAEQNAEKINQRSSNFYYHRFNFESNAYYLRELDVYRNREDNFKEINHNLDLFYFAGKMKLASSLLARAITTNFHQSSVIEAQIPLVESIKTYLSEADINTFPYLIQLYYRVLMVYTNIDDIVQFLELKALLSNFDSSIPEDVAEDISNSIETYCAAKINTGHPEFNNYALEIYKIMIANHLITPHGQLSPWRFKNIISAATWMKEFDWLENFINTYAQYLPDDFKDNAVTFNLARISFEKRQYEKVITLLREVEYEDITYNLQSKSMLLMTYYDTDEYEALDYIIESFRVFLNRHKEIPKQRQTYFKNLIKFTKKLTRVIPGDAKAIQKLKQEIAETPGFKVRWLEEKIAALEAGK